MLNIQELHVAIKDDEQEKPILHGLNLNIQAGSVHAIMGPNGSGKSTLAHFLAGKANYVFKSGQVDFLGEDLLALLPEERAARGLFLAFQYPIDIPGVNNMYFLRTALNNVRKAKGLHPLDAADFLLLAKKEMQTVGLDQSFLHRAVNEGFSGGEKKRNEVLQMLLLQPKLIILDETDSGLDIDSLQLVGRAVNQMRDNNRAILIVTHYQRLLDYVEPDVVHVMRKGQIIKSGDKTLATELEAKGYGFLS